MIRLMETMGRGIPRDLPAFHTMYSSEPHIPVGGVGRGAAVEKTKEKNYAIIHGHIPDLQ